MAQSRKKSMMESIANLVIGLIIGYITNALLLPMLGMYPSPKDNIILLVVFSALSVARSYGIRRWFNRSAPTQ